MDKLVDIFVAILITSLLFFFVIMFSLFATFAFPVLLIMSVFGLVYIAIHGSRKQNKKRRW